VETRDSEAVKAGYMTISINGYDLGSVQVKDNDADGTLVTTINKFTAETGVKASIDTEGKLTLTSIDGRAMQINIKKTAIYTSTNTSSSSTGGSSGGGSSGGGGWWDIIDNFLGIGAGAGDSGSDGTTTITVSTSTFESLTVGRLTLMRSGARDIILSGTNLSVIGMADSQNIAQRTLSLRNIRGGFTADDRSAIGANPNSGVQNMSEGLNAGVITLKGAMAVMDIVESAQKSLDKIRTDLGATQNKMYAAINSVSITHVNLKAAESQIRDVDFASESANFSKEKLMILAGNYAMTQASITQQTVMRVLE
jgi:flagellin